MRRIRGSSRRRPGRRDAGGTPMPQPRGAADAAGFAMALCAVLLPWCAPPVAHAEPEDAHRSPGFLYGSASRASRLHCHAGPAALVSASWPAHLASPGLWQAGSTCRTASRRWARCRTGGGR